MDRTHAILRAIAICLITTATISTASAGPREDLLAGYAAAAKTAEPNFSGFDATRGKTLHEAEFTGGKPDSPSCATCHSSNPKQSGETRTGKSIEPMAVSVSGTRYMKADKVEKWFKRNCNEVMGRACTDLEKGDWLTYMMSL